MMRRDAVEVGEFGGVGGGVGVALGRVGVGRRMERREWRGRKGVRGANGQESQGGVLSGRRGA